MSETTTDGAATDSSSTVPTGSTPSGDVLVRNEDRPEGERGRTSIADTVVAKIAGIATREISGVHDLGGSTQRVVGKVRGVIPGTTASTTQGIDVEVGERQAAVDVAIVADYGVAIHQLAAAIRSNIITAIDQMTGLETTEVNVTVHDIAFGDEADSSAGTPRVE